MRSDALVIGAGPVGLSAAIALGRLGIDVTVLERRETTSRHPKAHYENARTMEIFRQWGVDEGVRADALPPTWLTGATFVTTLAGHELGSIRWDEDPTYLETAAALGPAPPSSTAQDRVEPVLARKAESFDNVKLRFGAKVVGVDQDAEGVTVEIEDPAGNREEIHAGWAIAADGANSTARQLLDVPWSGPGAAGSQIGIYFHADLGRWTDDRPYVLYWIYSPLLQGVMIALDGKERWHLLFAYDADQESPEDFTPERCARLVAEGVIGDPDCAVDIRSVLPWNMQIFTAERFREGRIFLAGDAAHAMPPTGGLGLNSGVGDAHNLAWKLAARIRGRASDSLLDTYEAERKPVAEANAAYSMRNAVKMAETGLVGILSNDAEALAQIESAEGADLREQLAAAIPLQREQFYFDGATFGYVYESEAIVPDGSPPVVSTASEYRETARPGARAPHCRLRDGEQIVSTVDLSDGCLLVLAGAQGGAWVEAAAKLEAGFPVRAYTVRTKGESGAGLIDEDGHWADRYGLDPDGAVLIRPDGHVAWRSRELVDDPAAELALATGRIFGDPVGSSRR